MAGRLTAAQCAVVVGYSEKSWRADVSRGRAPAALPGYDPELGVRVWDEDAVREYAANRPGRGARTDLKQAE